MATPDPVSAFGLVLDDTSAEDLYDLGMSHVTTRLPDWNPPSRVADFASVVLEGVAVIDHELIVRVNSLPGALTEVHFRQFGVDRDDGAPATTTVEVTLADTAGHDLPAGLSFGVLLDTQDVAVLVTTEARAVPPGSGVATVAAAATSVGTDANGIAAGTALSVLDGNPLIESARLASAIVNGRDAEDDDTYWARVGQRANRLTDTLVKPGHFTARALEEPGVAYAVTLKNYKPDATPAGAPGDHPGYVTTAVYGSTGPLATPARTALQTSMQAQKAGNLHVYVVDAEQVAVDVDVNVWPRPGYDPADVEARVITAVTDYLNGLGFASPVYVNELVALVDNVDGVDREIVVDLVTNDDDLVGFAPLIVAGDVVVHMQDLPE